MDQKLEIRQKTESIIKWLVFITLKFWSKMVKPFVTNEISLSFEELFSKHSAFIMTHMLEMMI